MRASIVGCLRAAAGLLWVSLPGGVGDCLALRVAGGSGAGGVGRRRALGAVLGAIAAAVVVLLSAQPALGAPQPVTFSAPINLPAGTNPFSVAVGDFNEDAKPDLAVTNSGSNNVSLLLANGSGGFTGPTNFPVGTEPLHVAVGDFNGDGKVDLAVVNSGSNNVWVLLGDGSGGFTGPTNFFARSPSANAQQYG